MRTFAIVVAAALVAGCEPRVPASTAKLRDMQTIHDGDARRVWIILVGTDGHERVVHCDQSFLKEHGSLCVQWPIPGAGGGTGPPRQPPFP